MTSQFDIACSNMQSTSLASAYKNHENEKKPEYGERVREIENATFRPLVLQQLVEWGKKRQFFTRE